MESDTQVQNSKKRTHVHSLTGISTIVVISVLIGMYTLSRSEQLVDQITQYSVQNNDASVRDALRESWQGTKDTSNQSSSLLDTVQSKSLQGEPYALTIKAQGTDFDVQDCTVTPDPVTGAYGDTIYVPSGHLHAQNNKITRLAPNREDTYTHKNESSFGVHDACTVAIDGDSAEISLPKNEKGYYVVTRVIGKPTNNPELTINGHMQFIEDEYGSEFLVLGIITSTGFQTPIQISAQTVSASVATDISGLFEWSGRVCYANETSYCTNESDNTMCTKEQLCCVDTNEDELIDSCIDSTRNFDGTRSCTTGKPVVLSCREYVNESLFSIDEFVQYFWSVDEAKNFKEARILFYPVR